MDRDIDVALRATERLIDTATLPGVAFTARRAMRELRFAELLLELHAEGREEVEV